MKSPSIATCLILLLLFAAAGEANSWTVKPSIPTSVYEGGGLTYASFPASPRKDSVYAQCGADPFSGNKFYYFDISDNNGVGQWHELSNTTFQINTHNGGAISYAPHPNNDYNRIYSLQGAQQLCYFRHNTLLGTWTNSGHNLTYHYAGCALTYGGPSSSGWDQYLYAFKGGAQGDESKEFHRFQYNTVPTKGGERADGWTRLNDFDRTVEVRHGALTYNTKYHSSGAKIYGLAGGGSAGFKGYNPTQGTWAALTSPWSTVGPGVALEAMTVMFASSDSTDSIYALRGYTTDAQSRNFRLWRDISGSPTWVSRANLPWTPGARAGADLAFCPTNRRLYALRGGGTPDFAEYNPYGDFEEGGGSQGEAVVTQTPEPVRAVPVGTRQFRLSCPAAAGGAAVFQVFDAVGRELWRRSTRAGEVVWSADEAGARSGAYVVAATWSGGRSTGRLVVVR